ncbi:hypothetical protein EP7_002417 [Isosphaeraceae bacterium EP7]
MASAFRHLWSLGGTIMLNFSPPPRQLDGADVIDWAVSRRGLFHTIPHGADPGASGVICVAAMAICRYSEGAVFYLFKCDRDWEVVFDWDAESVEEAKEIASMHAKAETVEWQPIDKLPPSK